jgi:hypothetical protein
MSEAIKKTMGNIYSRKKQRTLSYQLDQKIKAEARISSIRHKKLHPSMTQRLLKDSSTSPLDLFKRLESFASVGSKSRNLSKLYESKLLPSQFLSTPMDVLNKMTEKVYNYNHLKQAPSLLPYFPQSKSYNKTKIDPLFENKDSPKDFHAKLEDECNDILKNNQDSRKNLKIDYKMVMKRKRVTNKLIQFVEKSTERSNFTDFQKKLKEAHSLLAKNGMIKPKSHKKISDNIFKTFN